MCVCVCVRVHVCVCVCVGKHWQDGRALIGTLAMLTPVPTYVFRTSYVLIFYKDISEWPVYSSVNEGVARMTIYKYMSILFPMRAYTT